MGGADRHWLVFPRSSTDPGDTITRSASRGDSVTVCVAAICDGGTIIGASDRMITAGDVQFEPQQTKVVYLTKSIAVMFAGDSAMQAEIIHRTRLDVAARVHADPDEWLAVSAAAEIYAKHSADIKSERAETSYLRPLGLTPMALS
jgi:20S proteasome alpha/beta subunit